MPPIFPAHGALGYWDELIFFSVAVIFLIFMGVSWVRSRALEPEFEEGYTPSTPPDAEPTAAPRPANLTPATDPRASDAPERFKLD